MNLLAQSSEPICWEFDFLSDDEIEKLKIIQKLIQETARVNSRSRKRKERIYT